MKQLLPRLNKKFIILFIVLAAPLFFQKYVLRFINMPITYAISKYHELKIVNDENFIKDEITRFCIMSLGYNVKNYGIKSVKSVINQNYSNWHLHIIDDASTDDSYESLMKYLDNLNFKHKKITAYKNPRNVGMMTNLTNISKYCNDDDVVVMLDWDDWFYNNNVLSILNNEYAKNDYWFVISRLVEKINYKISDKNFYSEYEFKNNKFRHMDFLFTSVKSFKAWLFKKINLSDFKNEKGEFFTVADDVILYSALAELTPYEKFNRILYPPLYFYNNSRPENVFRLYPKKHKETVQSILSKPRYAKIYSKEQESKYMD